MKKVLILGGAGFIGFHLAKFLASRGECEITIADNFFRGKKDDELSRFVESHPMKIIEGDFTQPEAFLLLDSRYDDVYMLASVVGVTYAEEVPNELIRINSFLILNTLEWLKHAVPRRVVFTSTSECYAGTIESFGYQIPTPETVPLCIQDISHPRFSYAVTKILGESGFLNYSKVFGFECNIVRYHNVYGPRMGFKHVIPQVVQRFQDHENPFQIIGYDQTRSFNFVTDAISGTVRAMESDGVNREIFHIGTQEEISIEELVRYIGELLEFSGKYEHKRAPSGSVSRRCPDITKARKILGYEPKVSWRDGVRSTVDWYREFIASGKKAFE